MSVGENALIVWKLQEDQTIDLNMMMETMLLVQLFESLHMGLPNMFIQQYYNI